MLALLFFLKHEIDLAPWNAKQSSMSTKKIHDRTVNWTPRLIATKFSRSFLSNLYLQKLSCSVLQGEMA